MPVLHTKLRTLDSSALGSLSTGVAPPTGRTARASNELFPRHLGDTLSDDELLLIIEELDAHTLAAFASSSQRIYNLTRDEALWHRLLRNHLSSRQFSVDAATHIAISCAATAQLLVGQRQELLDPRTVQGCGPGTSTQLRLAETSLNVADISMPGFGMPGPLALTAASSSLAPVRRMHISEDGMTVSFVGEQLGGNRAIRCEPSLPHAPHDTLRVVRKLGGGHSLVLVRQCTVSYFEVELSAVQTGVWSSELDCIAVGMGSARFPLVGRQPGWDGHSFGYHSDDGRIFHGSGTGSHAFGPTFGPGDVVGCGILLSSRQIFYTLNGKFLGIAFYAKAAHIPLYPVVGLDSHVAVKFNFGERPFAYDLDSLPTRLRKGQHESAPPPDGRALGADHPCQAQGRTDRAALCRRSLHRPGSRSRSSRAVEADQAGQSMPIKQTRARALSELFESFRIYV